MCVAINLEIPGVCFIVWTCMWKFAVQFSLPVVIRSNTPFNTGLESIKLDFNSVHGWYHLTSTVYFDRVGLLCLIARKTRHLQNFTFHTKMIYDKGEYLRSE